MMGWLLIRSSTVFDGLQAWWDSVVTQKRLASALILVFLVGLAMIEAFRLGWLPRPVNAWMASHGYDKHFDAIVVAFTLLLLAEVVALVLALSQSVANAAGKQFEIMSLILIRQSFKELTYFDEPIVWGQMGDAVSRRVLFILSDATGALVIFALLAVYYRMQRHRPITRDADERTNFVAGKKLIALLLLACLLVLGVDSLWTWWIGAEGHGFFEVFYTLLIFADVLVVLISMRYNTPYPVVFRYFGFAVATVLIRLALTAPRVIDAGLGVAGTLFGLALTWAYNSAGPVLHAQETTESE
jgi:hypothetical protein